MQLHHRPHLLGVLLLLDFAELLLDGAVQLTEQSYLLTVLQEACWGWRLVCRQSKNMIYNFKSHGQPHFLKKYQPPIAPLEQYI